jgi:hypothetical protein
MTGMFHRNLQRVATITLIVLLASFLSPTFAQGAVSASHDFQAHDGHHAWPASDDDTRHVTHDHGHALDEHGNLGHQLGHLPGSTVEFAATLPILVAPFPRADQAMALATANPHPLFRPPRPDLRP